MSFLSRSLKILYEECSQIVGISLTFSNSLDIYSSGKVSSELSLIF